MDEKSEKSACIECLKEIRVGDPFVFVSKGKVCLDCSPKHADAPKTKTRTAKGVQEVTGG